jgi:hypothetical protein
MNIAHEAEGWAEDEISRQRFGEDYDYAISLGRAMAQTPQGPRPVPMWMLFLTARNPMLGEGPLYHGPVPVGAPKPVEAEVRAQVAEGLRLLRELAASKLAGANGHARR